jgi:hypothetical protein
MNVYRPSKARLPSGDDVHACLLISDESFRHVPRQKFKGLPIPLTEWTPIPVIRDYSIKDNLSKALGDRAGLDANIDPMVLSRRALDILTPHIGALGQALPLAFDEAEYFAFNITNVVDALDEAASGIWKFPSTGRIGNIKSYVFNRDAVHDQWLFKIPQQSSTEGFVTDRFVDLVKSAGLTGFGFVHLWSDQVNTQAKAA